MTGKAKKGQQKYDLILIHWTLDLGLINKGKIYGKIDIFGFSEERKRLVADEWNINEIGSQTALGDALRIACTIR